MGGRSPKGVNLVEFHEIHRTSWISMKFREAHGNTRILLNSTESREKGAALAADSIVYCIPIGIQ